MPYADPHLRRVKKAEFQRRYRQTPEGKEAFRRYQKSAKGKVVQARAIAKYSKTENGKLVMYRGIDRYRQTARGKTAAVAHKIVGRAIERGDLFRQPCEVCGNPKVHAHHDDYDKPLEVRWLCRGHHVQYHQEVRHGTA